jgi:hypothetical protein
MMSLQSKLQAFKTELTGICSEVWHYSRPTRTQPPFLIWAEDGEGSTTVNADNHKAEQSIHGFIDYFTLTEFDSAVDDVQDVLNAHGSEWRLNDVQKEEETNLLHYSWEFEI